MSDASNAVLEIEDLRTLVDSGAETVHALRGVDLVIRRNEFVASVASTFTSSSGTMRSTSLFLTVTSMLDRVLTT